nr:hypothetical protein Iba_chr15aCG12320 [Ipomoea batatas]
MFLQQPMKKVDQQTAEYPFLGKHWQREFPSASYLSRVFPSTMPPRTPRFQLSQRPANPGPKDFMKNGKVKAANAIQIDIAEAVLEDMLKACAIPGKSLSSSELEPS